MPGLDDPSFLQVLSAALSSSWARDVTRLVRDCSGPGGRMGLRAFALSLVVCVAAECGGCATPPSLPGRWVVVGDASNLHPYSDPRRMHPELESVTPDGEGFTVVVRNADGPLHGVEVFTSLEEGPEFVVTEADRPEDLVARIAAGGPVARSVTARTDREGRASLRDPLLAESGELHLHFEAAGFFSEMWSRDATPR
jgi:hypothetical protein